MLVHLTIDNFAIIRHLEITFSQGLNILSGETGTGKSIIINAVNLILGSRASSDLIRTGSDEATVEAFFSFPGNIALRETMSGLGIDFDGDLLVKRTVYKEGRNKISINGSMATLQMLSRLGPFLISISGQHDHQRLLKQDTHLLFLDEFGNLFPDLEMVGKSFSEYQILLNNLKKHKQEIKETKDTQELAEFQIREIEMAALRPGEDDALMSEKKRLQHAEELLNIASEGYLSFYEKNASIMSFISQYIRKLERGMEFDKRFEDIKTSLSDVELKLEDISFSLRDLKQGIHSDPHRLNEIYDRLELINRLKKKYGPDIEQILLFKKSLENRIFDIEEKKERIAALERELLGAESKLCFLASALSEKRKTTALRLEESVLKELQFLHMDGTEFKVKFDEITQDIKGIRSDGYDTAEFMISPNIGEELRPLSKIVSGGELSRIMLALKTILAKSASVETIIFDEVDSGISGATAESVGEKILSLSGFHQIVCITHLPQIASQGNTHFLIKKQVDNGRTQTTVEKLDPESRIAEISRLLGGKKIIPSAVAHAKEMLKGLSADN